MICFGGHLRKWNPCPSPSVTHSCWLQYRSSISITPASRRQILPQSKFGGVMYFSLWIILWVHQRCSQALSTSSTVWWWPPQQMAIISMRILIINTNYRNDNQCTNALGCSKGISYQNCTLNNFHGRVRVAQGRPLECALTMSSLQ